jgi:parallel beta-helix repeat protein
MKRKWLAVGIILLFIGTCIIPAIAQDAEKPLPASRGDWLYVGGSGPGNYTKIQEAIDDASNGDMILVYSGSYYEVITINKQLSLKGIKINGQDNPVINGGNDHNSVTIENDSCIFENFTVMNGNAGFGKDAIYVSSNNIMIKNCVLYHTGTGIYFSSSHNNVIYNNEIKGDGWRGIIFYSSSNNSIIKNSFHDFNNEAIWLRDNSTHNWFYQNIIKNSINIEESPFNIFEENNISVSPRGLMIESSKNTSVLRNSFIGNGIHVSGTLQELSSNIIADNLVDDKPLLYYINEKGIHVLNDVGQIILINCSFFTIQNCSFSGAQRGIVLFYSSNNTIRNNTITSASPDDIQLSYSHDNIISGNILDGGSGGIILVTSERNIVTDNIVSNIQNHPAIDVADSSNNIVYNNAVHDCRMGIVVDFGSEYNNVSNNCAENCSTNIWVYACADNYFSHNVINKGGVGIRVEGGSGHTFYDNRMTNCTVGLAVMENDDNYFSHNSIVKNNQGMTISLCQNITVYYNEINDNQKGLGVSLSKKIKIENNNIIGNLVDADFTVYGFYYWPASKIIWNGNYWGMTLPRHKMIAGKLQTAFGLPVNPFEIVYFTIPWINFDRNPAQEPYDIGT